ncbi:MAG: hypothetical protein F4X76_12935, partial [Chloroflexi bacterium]|nr:hypothetical protein [Chloroflexota bacterium]
MAHVDIALGANYSLTSSTHLWADAQIADTALPDEIEADGGRLNLFSVADWTGFNVAACRVEFSVAGLVTAEAIDSLYFRLTVGSQSVDSPRFPHEKDATGPRYSATLTPSDGAVYTEWLAWIKAARLLFPLVTTTGTLRVQDGPFASGSITNKIATLSETATHDFN